MQKIRNRSGVALGAISALLLSLFSGVTPASATNEGAAVVSPLGSGALSANSVVMTETFELYTRYGTSVQGVSSSAMARGTAPNYKLFFSVSSESMGIIFKTHTAADFDGATQVAGANVTSVSAAASNPTGPATGYFTVPSTSPYVSVELGSDTSLSAAVSVTVTPFIDNDGTAGYSVGDSIGTSYTLNFVPWSALGASMTLADPVQGDRGITASVTVTAGSIRWSQLNGAFAVGFSHTGEALITNDMTISAQATAAAAPSTYATSGSNLVTGNYSFSASVFTDTLTTVGGVASVSATLYYITSNLAGNSNPANVTAGMALLATSTKAVSGVAAAGTTLSPVTSANIMKVGDNAANARYNSSFTLNAFPYSASATTSILVNSAFTVSSFAGIEFGAAAGVTIAGVSYTTSTALLNAGFTLPAGVTTIAMSTFGQTADATDNIAMTLTSQLASNNLTVSFKEVALTAVYAPTAVASLAGATRSFAVTVTDQWGSLTPRTDMRLHASLALTGGSTSTAVAAISGGAATVAIAPAPATKTGSATLTLQPQYFNQSTQGWEDLGTADSVDWNVYSYTAGTDGFESPQTAGSVSASISYGVVAYSWSDTVRVTVTNSFSEIAVSAPGLVIRNADQTSITGSGTLTVAANAKAGNFQFASKIAGTYTVTFTNGTATTTSLVVIDAAGHDKGDRVIFDKTNLEAGKTTTITGTLVDSNGNPVATGGTASVAVSYTGAGLPYGNSTTMQTDADGKLTFQVLVLSTEKGDAAITAVYKPANASVSTANKTSVHALTIGGATTASSDQKVNAGSFKGFVAVYAKGYIGQRLSAKVGNDWVVVPSLASNFVRVVEFTGAGYTIAVRIYIDRVLVDTITVTTR